MVQVIAAIRRGTGHLFHQDRGTRTAPAGTLAGAFGSNIIGNQDGTRIYGLCRIAGHGEVHDIAGVVLHNVQHSPALVSPLRGFADLDRVRGGKEQARAGSGEHALPNEAGVHGLVAGSATGDDRDRRFIIGRAQRGAAPDEARVVPGGIGMLGDEPGQGIRQEGFLAIAKC